jgi:hypothetical protein
MGNQKIAVMSDQTAESLHILLSQRSSEDLTIISNISEMIFMKVIQREKSIDRNNLLTQIESICIQESKGYTQAELKLIRCALVAKFALDLPGMIEKLNLPKSILNIYPAAFERLANSLSKDRKDAYDITDDLYKKDIDFVLGLSVPCGAQVVELRSKILFRSIIRSIFRPGNLIAVLKYIKAGVTGTWFRIHTDSRHLIDFNELGWNECYGRIAELLERRKSIRGMVGTSWFYDPQLLTISPHLAYLQLRPLERGAFLIRHGSRQVDIERAISKSKTRRNLYREGKYKPISYSLLWPREELISWSKSQLQDKTAIKNCADPLLIK